MNYIFQLFNKINQYCCNKEIKDYLKSNQKCFCGREKYNHKCNNYCFIHTCNINYCCNKTHKAFNILNYTDKLEPSREEMYCTKHAFHSGCS